VLLLGSSAGGQIATAVGTYGTGTTYVRGVVALSPVASPYRAYKDGQAAGVSASKQKLRDNSTLLARCYPTSSDTTCWKRWTDAVVKTHASSGDAPCTSSTPKGLRPLHTLIRPVHRAQAKTVSCTLQVVAGSGHASAILKVSGIHTKNPDLATSPRLTSQSFTRR
jgi:hypothetical protein